MRLPARLLAAGLLALAAPAAADESAVSAPGPAGALQGTMLLPSPSAPMVLIIPGSGPTDRDGNSPIGIRAATYRLLAEGLAARGIASVRIDKRGLHGSAAAAPDADAATIDDYAVDIEAWIEALRDRTGAACIWLLGHGEGGLVALVAAQRRTDVCGLLLVATAGRPLGAVLREQFGANPPGPLRDQAMAIVDALAAGRRVDVTGMHPALRTIFRASVQGFLISELRLDPAALMSACHRRVLILQGARDVQVGVADAHRLAATCPAAELILLPDANHLLKAVASDDRGANLAAYGDPSLPLAAGVVDAVAGFVARAPAAR